MPNQVPVLTPDQLQRLRSAVTAPDWRVGLHATPKYLAHEIHGQRGEVVATYPSGAGGIEDPDGVLQIRMQSGRVLMGAAGEWTTA